MDDSFAILKEGLSKITMNKVNQNMVSLQILTKDLRNYHIKQ